MEAWHRLHFLLFRQPFEKQIACLDLRILQVPQLDYKTLPNLLRDIHSCLQLQISFVISNRPASLVTSCRDGPSTTAERFRCKKSAHILSEMSTLQLSGLTNFLVWKHWLRSIAG